MTPNVGGEATVLPMLRLAVRPQSRLKCKRVLYYIVWGSKVSKRSLVLHPRVPNSSLQAVNADRVAPAERSRPQDSTPAALLTRPAFCIATPPLALLPPSTPGQARLPSIQNFVSSSHRVVVLPHEAPSRVIALASVRQPYSPLIACARVADAPPFTSCSTVYVVASQEAAPLNESTPGRSPGVNPGTAASRPSRPSKPWNEPCAYRRPCAASGRPSLPHQTAQIQA